MQLANLRDFKTHLARYLRLVERGESIAVTRNGRPVAMLTRPPARANGKRALTEAEWWEKAIREGLIIPPSAPMRLPRLTPALQRAGRRALAQLLKDRRS